MDYPYGVVSHGHIARLWEGVHVWDSQKNQLLGNQFAHFIPTPD
jgi:hypothetical protein